MLELLRSLEWCAPFVALPHTNCPACGRRRENGHAPDCRLDRAIRGAVSVEPLRPPLTTEEKARALGYARNASAGVDADGVWCSDALIDVRWTEHLIRGQQRAREAASEPTVDEMAREMGLTRGVYRNWTTDSDADLVQLETDGQWVWRPSGTLRDHDLRSWPTDADAIRTLYREHKAKQRPPLTRFTCSRADCDDDQPHAHIESNLPIVDATKPPTDPAALAAWLYARVVPGRMVVERGGEYKAVVRSVARGRRCIILTGPDGEQVTAPGTLNLHLLNPDGTVLWEAP